MASVFELKFTEKHGVAESTLMLATMSGGHFYNMVNHEAAMDNGSVSALDITQWEEGDVFKTKVPTVKDKVVLILTAPKIYEEYATQCQEECFFYNGANERMRAYEVYDTDRFALSLEAFKDSPTVEPAKGKYVVVDGTGYKLDVVDSASVETNGFVGYIYDVAPNGNFKIFVIQNKTIA